MDFLFELSKLLPIYEEIQSAVDDNVSACYILQKAAANISQMQKLQRQLPDTEECGYLISALVDRSWEEIHTGHFSNVAKSTRKIYALACHFKIFYILFDCTAPAQLEKCSEILDEAQLVGITGELYVNSAKLEAALFDYFNQELVYKETQALPTLVAVPRQVYQCDIPTYDCPAVADFNRNCFQAHQPVLLLNTIKHWPALQKWRDLNYLMRVAGNRTVPIEIGDNYTTDEWSQQMVKIRDFLSRQFGTSGSNTTIEYLAQHELFEQIPKLKADIRIPDYCVLGEDAANVDIKAWLGPKGTVSPMHYDPKHNLLCQVFGTKYVKLAAPGDGDHLYPHESEFLTNTAQIDAANLDLANYPLAGKVKFYEVMLQEGDCLYMPPKWWHYVRAETASFSVSFWFE